MGDFGIIMSITIEAMALWFWIERRNFWFALLGTLASLAAIAAPIQYKVAPFVQSIAASQHDNTAALVESLRAESDSLQAEIASFHAALNNTSRTGWKDSFDQTKARASAINDELRAILSKPPAPSIQSQYIGIATVVLVLSLLQVATVFCASALRKAAPTHGKTIEDNGNSTGKTNGNTRPSQPIFPRPPMESGGYFHMENPNMENGKSGKTVMENPLNTNGKMEKSNGKSIPVESLESHAALGLSTNFQPYFHMENLGMENGKIPMEKSDTYPLEKVESWSLEEFSIEGVKAGKMIAKHLEKTNTTASEFSNSTGISSRDVSLLLNWEKNLDKANYRTISRNKFCEVMAALDRHQHETLLQE